MNIRLAILAVFISLSGLSTASQATDYYVSPSGSDANSGTSPGGAWQTISKVNSTIFSPGDNIYFEGGETFSGSLSFSSADSGTSLNPVTVGSYGTGRATISSGTSRGFYASNCEGFVVRDLIFVGSGGDDTSGSDGVFFYRQGGGAHLEYIRIDNLDVSGYYKTGIILGGSVTNGFRDVRITNCVVHDGGDVGISTYGKWPVQERAHQDIYVGDCEVYNIRGQLAKTNNHTGNGILLWSIDGAVIEFCEAYNNGELNSGIKGGPIGIWAWEANDVVIQFCESYDNDTNNAKDGGGFDLDGGVLNSIMQYNYSHGNTGAGYGVYQFGGAREFRNITVRYNISENDGLVGGYGGISLWSMNSAGGIQDTKIHNNTVYVSENTQGAGIGDIPDGGTTYIYNTEIYNNIIVTEPNKKVVNIKDPSGGWTFKGNCYWTYGDNIEIDWDGVTYTSLSAWRSATGQETHDGNDVGFELDPQLIDPGNGGTLADPCLLETLDAYRLASSSGLIDEGLDIQTEFGINPGLRDYYGEDIPIGNQYDVGAHEYRHQADFNYDHNVNFLDYAELAEAWQSSLGQPAFNEIYDLYDDDIIDANDLGLFCDDWLGGVGP
ncbi:MAG: right-handed parallel beta-helix repeat-containing protein [Planctomycetota bacterium]|jgi:hypothetical protein